MRVNSNFVPAGRSAREVQAGTVAGGQKDALVKEAQAKPLLREKASVTESVLPHEELVALAKELNSGEINAKEATGKFISKVLDKSFGKSANKSQLETISKEIFQLLCEDPNFSKQLEKNLKEMMA